MRPEHAARAMTEECLALRVRRLSRVVTRLFDGAVRPLGLTPSQLTLLAVLERSGPSAPSAVARVLDLEKSTLSRTLGRMRGAGWVRERPHGASKRLELTPAGRVLLGKAYDPWHRAQAQARDLLGARVIRALLNLDT